MFEHDRSAARGLMCARALLVFEHATALGNKAAYELFERVKCQRKTEGPARDFSDYTITVDGRPLTSVFEKISVS